jgi:hypothetical protein
MWACAPRDHPGIHRNATLNVGEPRNHLQLTRQFQHRAGALVEVDSRVGSYAADRKPVIANPFARGFGLPLQPRSGLQHQHGLAPFCHGFGGAA